jgi:hypothetical protein
MIDRQYPRKLIATARFFDSIQEAAAALDGLTEILATSPNSRAVLAVECLLPDRAKSAP